MDGTKWMARNGWQSRQPQAASCHLVLDNAVPNCY